MDEGLKKNWNDFVPKSATVYMLGDVSFGYKANKICEYLEGLNGKKHLIYGNHDKIIRKNEVLFSERIFESIQEYKEIRINNQTICLFHYAPRVWNGSHRGSWCLWGHSHGKLEPYAKSVDVGIDSSWITGKIEHRPFSFEEIKKFMETRTEIKDS